MTGRILLIAACILMFCGCIQEDSENVTTSAMTTTTTSSQTTSSTTTTTATAAQATTTTTSCSTTTTTMPWDKDCVEYCTGAGYLSGSCQVNLQECQRRLMEAPRTQRSLCSDRRFDYCCCKTNESIDKDTCFAFDALGNKYL